MKTQKKEIEIDKGAIVLFLSEDEALDKMYKLLRISNQDIERAKTDIEKTQIKKETIWGIEAIIRDTRPSAEILPSYWRNLSWDELNILVSRMFIQSNKKLFYLI
jgi:hypothetical protein